MRRTNFKCTILYLGVLFLNARVNSGSERCDRRRGSPYIGQLSGDKLNTCRSETAGRCRPFKA